MSRFDYQIIAPDDDLAIPFTPFVHIIPTRFSRDETRWPRLSPQLMTAGEIDCFIEACKQCKQDLDKVGKLAKGALKRALPNVAQ